VEAARPPPASDTLTVRDSALSTIPLLLMGLIFSVMAAFGLYSRLGGGGVGPIRSPGGRGVPVRPPFGKFRASPDDDVNRGCRLSLG
jgi:hypothetical protein